MCNVGINIILVHNELSRSCDHCIVCWSPYMCNVCNACNTVDLWTYHTYLTMYSPIVDACNCLIKFVSCNHSFVIHNILMLYTCISGP